MSPALGGRGCDKVCLFWRVRCPLCPAPMPSEVFASAPSGACVSSEPLAVGSHSGVGWPYVCV